MRTDLVRLRPLGGAEDDATLIYLPLEPDSPVPATFDLPNPYTPGSQEAALLLRDATSAQAPGWSRGLFRSFLGNLNVEPRAYQLVPLLMALKTGHGQTPGCRRRRHRQDHRGGTDRARNSSTAARSNGWRSSVPPHLCEQWQQEFGRENSASTQRFVSDEHGDAPRTRNYGRDESIFRGLSLHGLFSPRLHSSLTVAEMTSCAPVRSSSSLTKPILASSRTPNTRHQRYQLLKGAWAESKPHAIHGVPHRDTAFGAMTRPFTICLACWNRDFARSWLKCPRETPDAYPA